MSTNFESLFLGGRNTVEDMLRSTSLVHHKLHSPIRAKHGSGGIVTRAGGAEQVAQGGWPSYVLMNAKLSSRLPHDD